MSRFQIASQTVQEALATGRIGTPVAVRVIAHLTSDHGRVERLAARVLESVAGWLGGDAPRRLTALGSVETGQISTLVQLDGGQSALISAGSCSMGPPLLEITVWGNRGVLAWEDADRVAAADEETDDDPLSESARQWLDRIHRSLRSGRTLQASTEPQSQRHIEKPLRPLAPPYGVLLVAGDHTHQPNYSEALAADPRCRLIGVTDEAQLTERRPQLNQQFADRLGIPLLPDLQQAFHRDDVHIVSVCAEPARRGRILIEAARAGKHLYLDKPLAGSLSDADAIVSAVGEAGVVSHMWSLVGADCTQQARAAIRAGRLGDPVALHLDMCFAKGYSGTATLGRPRQETAVPTQYELPDSKRELTNVGVYPLVAILWLLGRKIRRACATTGNYFFREHQQNDMEDFGQMLLELEGGVVASLSAGRTGWRSHPGQGLNRVCVVGSQQSAGFDQSRPRVAVWADTPSWNAPPRNPADPMGMWKPPQLDRFAAEPKLDWITPPADLSNADARYFLDCIQHGRKSEIPASLAAAATEALLAAYRSAADGGLVNLPLART